MSKKPRIVPAQPKEETLDSLKDKTLQSASSEIAAILKKYKVKIIPVLTLYPGGSQGGIKIVLDN